VADVWLEHHSALPRFDSSLSYNVVSYKASHLVTAFALQPIPAACFSLCLSFSLCPPLRSLGLPLPTASPASARSPSSPHKSPMSCCHHISCPLVASQPPLPCVCHLSLSRVVLRVEAARSSALMLSCTGEETSDRVVPKPGDGSQGLTDFPILPRTAA